MPGEQFSLLLSKQILVSTAPHPQYCWNNANENPIVRAEKAVLQT
jgi:hypothetical protein